MRSGAQINAEGTPGQPHAQLMAALAGLWPTSQPKPAADWLQAASTATGAAKAGPALTSQARSPRCAPGLRLYRDAGREQQTVPSSSRGLDCRQHLHALRAKKGHLICKLQLERATAACTGCAPDSVSNMSS